MPAFHRAARGGGGAEPLVEPSPPREGAQRPHRCPLPQAASRSASTPTPPGCRARPPTAAVFQAELRDPAFYVLFHCAPKQTEVDDGGGDDGEDGEVEELQRTKLLPPPPSSGARRRRQGRRRRRRFDADGGAPGRRSTAAASLLTTYFEDYDGRDGAGGAAERQGLDVLRGAPSTSPAVSRSSGRWPPNRSTRSTTAWSRASSTPSRRRASRGSSTARTITGGATWSSTSTSCARSRRRSSPPSTASTGGDDGRSESSGKRQSRAADVWGGVAGVARRMADCGLKLPPAAPLQRQRPRRPRRRTTRRRSRPS